MGKFYLKMPHPACLGHRVEAADLETQPYTSPAEFLKTLWNNYLKYYIMGLKTKVQATLKEKISNDDH